MDCFSNQFRGHAGVVDPSLFETEGQLSDDQHCALSMVPDSNEIKVAAFSLKSHSFPGQDRLSCSLFHAARDIVGDTVIRAVQHLFHSGKILRVTNIFFLYLIFKCNPSVTFGDFRPINMLFSTYKIISKILRSLNGSHSIDHLNTPQDIDKH